MRVIDCFPYFNEKELLELRINLLHDKVDKFIITDANRTHRGTSKPFTCKDTLEELGIVSDKIQVIEVNLQSHEEQPNAWSRERMQRNAAAGFIIEGDICIVSDCDEIIDPNCVRYYTDVARKNPQNIIRIPLAFLMGRGDLRVFDELGNPVPWRAPYICLKSHLEKYTLSDVRESHAFGKHNIEFSDLFITENNNIEDAGWHFSWMGGEARIKIKSESFSHWNEVLLRKDYVPKENSTDFLGRKNHILNKYPVENLPKEIFDIPNAKKFLSV